MIPYLFFVLFINEDNTRYNFFRFFILMVLIACDHSPWGPFWQRIHVGLNHVKSESDLHPNSHYHGAILFSIQMKNQKTPFNHELFP